VTCEYDITVTDDQDPILANCIADQSVTSNPGVCTYTVSGTAWNATATDNCTTVTLTANVTGATTASGLTTLNGFVFNLGTSTVTWTATDGSLNTVTCSYDITVTDDQDPILANCIADQSVTSNPGVCTYTVSGTAWNATATDNCTTVTLTADVTGATTATGLTTLSGFVFNLGTSTVTWTATDGSLNTVSCSYDITVTDDQDPILANCIADQSVSSNAGVCTYTVSGTAWNATATDNCTTVTLTANVTGATTASGLTTLNGFVFNLGTSTVTWTATDGSLNTITCSYDITVTDDQDPILANCIADQSVTSNPGVCTYTVSGTAWNATATDNCTTVTLTANVTGATTASGLTTLNDFVFNLGTSTVTWTATDGTGNISQCSYTVTVTDDQLPAFTSCVGSTQNQNVDVNECNFTVSGTAWDAVATDNCTVSTVLATLSGATTASGLATLNNVNFNVGTTTVTWTATDGSGNIQTCVFNVVVTDNILPSFTSCGATGNQTVNANTGLCTYTHPNNSWNATATDNCTVSTLTASLTGVTTASGLTTLNGVTFNLGITTVTWTATDIHGNVSTCSFNVNVIDNQNPSITSCGAVGNQIVVADPSQCNFTQTGTGWNATASDNCSVSSIVYTLSGATTGSGTSLQGVDFNLGVTTVLWTVTDGSGNVSTCTFNVTVQDTQLPQITSCGATGNQTVSADLGVCTYTASGTAWDASATDNCTVSSLTYTLTGATLGTGTSLNNVVFNPGTTLVTWTVIDQSGNSSNCSFSVTVEDNENPVISGCPTNITTPSDAGVCGAIVNWTVPSYTDNCGAAMSFTHTPGTLFPVGTTTVTYTVTDGAGNVSICSFTVTVNDTELPAISCAQPIETCVPLVTFSAPVVSDNCGIASTVQTAGLISGVEYPVGITTNSYLVTDVNGNTNTCSFTVEVFPVPVIALDPTNVSCFEFDNGSIDATITVGTSPYTYDWNNNEITEDINGLAPGTYTLDVIDDNGCTASANAVITQPILLTLSAQDDHVNCFNGNDGSINIDVNGGTLPYTYDWSNNASSEDLTGLTAGAYDVTVTDFNGCEVTYATTITQPDSLMVSGIAYAANCGSPTGTISVTVSGGTNPYTFDWSNGATGMSLYNVVPGVYTLEVTDAQGCLNTLTETVNNSSSLSAELSVRDAKCYGENSGEITAEILSGYAPFTYEWTDGQASPTAINLAAGAYNVVITDMFGCEVTLSAEVNQPDSITIELSNSIYSGGYNISQYNGSDGYINATVDGGTSPYDFSWFGPQGFTSDQQNIINLKEGAYLLTVIDANGCKANISSRLVDPNVLEMPNGFSPNGDSDNEYFVVHGIDAYPDNTILVYNRWGNLVYELDGYNNEWNGDNMNGEPLPDATYFVVLTVRINGEDLEPLTGYVDLRR
jgi:gliding motility-associated-like protein